MNKRRMALLAFTPLLAAATGLAQARIELSEDFSSSNWHTDPVKVDLGSWQTWENIGHGANSINGSHGIDGTGGSAYQVTHWIQGDTNEGPYVTGRVTTKSRPLAGAPSIDLRAVGPLASMSFSVRVKSKENFGLIFGIEQGGVFFRTGSIWVETSGSEPQWQTISRTIDPTRQLRADFDGLPDLRPDLSPSGAPIRMAFATTEAANNVTTEGLWCNSIVLDDMKLTAVGRYPREALGKVHGRLVVVGSDAEPWSTDASLSGTRRLADLNPAGPSYPRRAFQVGGHLVFIADVSATHTGLFASDGETIVGPAAVWPTAELQKATEDPSAAFGVGIGSKAYFAAPGVDGAGQPLGIEPHYWDLPSGAVTLVRDIRPGPEGSDPRDFVAYRNRPHFSADNGGNGRELWWIDTDTLHCVFRDIIPGPDGSEPTELAVVGDFVFCNATLSGTGRRLVRFSANAQDSGGATSCRPAGSRHIAYYTSDNGTSTGLWCAVTTAQSLGTLAGELIPAVPGGGSFFAAAWHTFYVASDAAGLHEITRAGVGTVFTANAGERIRGVVEAGAGRFYFLVVDPSGTSETLWTSDGSAGGTIEVAGASGMPLPELTILPTAVGGRILRGFDNSPAGLLPVVSSLQHMAREVGAGCSPRRRPPLLMTAPGHRSTQYISMERLVPGDLVSVFFSGIDHTGIRWTSAGCADFVNMTGIPPILLPVSGWKLTTNPVRPPVPAGSHIRIQARVIGIDGSDSTSNAVSVHLPDGL